MKGRGIGRMLRNFMRWITPLAQKHIFPKIESGAKYVGTNLVETLANVVKDTIKGENLNQISRLGRRFKTKKRSRIGRKREY